MQSNRPARRFYCFPETGQVEGPFEIIELAGLLRASHITGETQTLLEGEEAWLPFQDRPEYHFAREIPQEAINRHVEETAEAQSSPFTPRKLLILVWILAPFFLYLAYRFTMMYLGYELHHHPVVETNLADPGGS